MCKRIPIDRWKTQWIQKQWGTCKKTVLRYFLLDMEDARPVKIPDDGLFYYEYALHYKLRRAWARVNGLVYLIHVSQTQEELLKIKRLLHDALAEIDHEMNEVGRKLANRKNQ